MQPGGTLRFRCRYESRQGLVKAEVRVQNRFDARPEGAGKTATAAWALDTVLTLEGQMLLQDFELPVPRAAATGPYLLYTTVTDADGQQASSQRVALLLTDSDIEPEINSLNMSQGSTTWQLPDDTLRLVFAPGATSVALQVRGQVLAPLGFGEIAFRLWRNAPDAATPVWTQRLTTLNGLSENPDASWQLDALLVALRSQLIEGEHYNISCSAVDREGNVTLVEAPLMVEMQE